ncbi:MAG: hypothetical protein JWL69_817 [Phycisphaerales bacterium]|jgi:hypothetical protein|nr:hypothetical protein [Phycisphaerales bacterium]MDB5354571.1 hypothetical protein [Phycisphaerales bacterium]
MVADIPKVLVLRLPAEEGNFSYRVAELDGQEARRLEHRLTSEDLPAGESEALRQELFRKSGEVLNLAQVMARLPADFRVLDYPKSH